MQLSAIGELVQEEWLRSFELRKELFCECYVIMPNHLHPILRIDNLKNSKDFELKDIDKQIYNTKPANFGVA